MLDRVIAARVFIETVERGTATAAAEALGMSRAMASRYLSAMEDWAGVRLLHRSTRHLGLTPAGENILEKCKSMIDVANRITDLSLEAQEPQGTLRVAVPGLFAYTVLVPVLKEFNQKYPKVVVDLHVSDRSVDLVQDRIDVALRMTNNLEQSVVARRLGTVRSELYASPEYIAKHGLPSSPQDLTNHACLIYARFGGHEWKLQNNNKTIVTKVNCALQTNDSIVLLGGALDSLGITMLPTFSAKPYLSDGRLVRVLDGWVPNSLNLYSLYSSRHHLPSNIRVFIDHVADYTSNSAEFK